MKTVKSAKRVRFEEDTFPHVDALWRTALWLTKRWSRAEDLVLNTMAEAYRLSPGSAEAIDSRTRLFRILYREFSKTGYPAHSRDRHLSQRSADTIKNSNGCGQFTHASIDQQGMSLLSEMSNVAVRGAVARLRPKSRLIMILLYREGFSYANIAYIAELERDSVRSILGGLRRLIPQYLVWHADCFVPDVVDNRSSLLARATPSDGDRCGG